MLRQQLQKFRVYGTTETGERFYEVLTYFGPEVAKETAQEQARKAGHERFQPTKVRNV
jgi:hypothetical protein